MASLPHNKNRMVEVILHCKIAKKWLLANQSGFLKIMIGLHSKFQTYLYHWLYKFFKADYFFPT